MGEMVTCKQVISIIISWKGCVNTTRESCDCVTHVVELNAWEWRELSLLKTCYQMRLHSRLIKFDHCRVLLESQSC